MISRMFKGGSAHHDGSSAAGNMNRFSPFAGDLGGLAADLADDRVVAEAERRVAAANARDAASASGGVDRFADEQLFEEYVRTVLSMMRPHRAERLMGWSEYRTGGAHFRATISWDKAFEETGSARDRRMTVPHLTDVLEGILVGSVRDQDELHAAEEFEIYRGVVRELYRRLDEMQSCYE